MRQWIKIVMSRTPYRDKNGKVLADISFMRNRPGIDEFSGGDKIRPDVSALNIIDSREAGEIVLYLVDNTEEELTGYNIIPIDQVLTELKALLPFPDGTTVDANLEIVLP